MVNPSSNLIVSLMSFATFSGGTKGVVCSADVKPALIHSIRLNLICVALVDISCKFRVFDVLLKVRRHYNKVSALLLRLPYSIAGFYTKGFCGVVFGEDYTVPFFHRAADSDRILLQNRVEHTFNRRIKVVHIAMQY